MHHGGSIEEGGRVCRLAAQHGNDLWRVAGNDADLRHAIQRLRTGLEHRVLAQLIGQLLIPFGRVPLGIAMPVERFLGCGRILRPPQVFRGFVPGPDGIGLG
ncbi:hypothetical protein, partial [Nocardia sp. NPDC056564]|uniref:hypothetical protein n=1 Tax=Nocardia sp. NPDC056564 TaxID=3345865 RepID=UPI00367275F5